MLSAHVGNIYCTFPKKTGLFFYRQSPPEECQEDQGEAETYQDGNKAGQSGVPVAIAAGLANLHKRKV